MGGGLQYFVGLCVCVLPQQGHRLTLVLKAFTHFSYHYITSKGLYVLSCIFLGFESPDDNIIQSLLTYLTRHSASSKKKILLLLDFDQLVFTEEARQLEASDLLTLSCHAFCTVLATTSGAGKSKLGFGAMKSLRNIYDSFKITIPLAPFTYAQAKLYAARSECKAFIKNLKFQTGFIPLVLKSCLYHGEKSSLIRCEELAARCNLDIFDSVFNSPIPFASGDIATFQRSIIIMHELLSLEEKVACEGEVASDSEGEVASDSEGEVASDSEGEVASDSEGGVPRDREGEVARDSEGEVSCNSEEQSAHLKGQIEELFIYKEGLIQYDCKDQLYIVHPSLARKVIAKLGSMIPMDASRDERAIEVINGYKFEWDLVHECGRKKFLSVAYLFEGGKVTTMDLVVEHVVSYDVVLRATPILGTLYLLRNLHPVIDVVGVLTSANIDEKFLILMQISLKSYQSHKKKSENLHDIITAPECPKSKRRSVLAYYKGLCSAKYKIQDNHILYVYASPKEMHLRPHEFAVQGIAVAKKEEKFAVATIPEDSISGRMIKTIVANLTI